MRSKIHGLFIILIFIALVDSNAQSNQVRFTLLKGADGITLGKVNAITRDRLGFVWLSDQTNRCIIRYDGAHMERFQYDSRNPDGLGGYYPECLATDSTGNIWVGFYNGEGVDRYDPVTNKFTHYKHDPKNPASLINGTVSAILVDRLGNVWIGTDGGLDMLNPATGTFTHYRNVPGDDKSLSHNIVRAIYEDREGTIWVGTGNAFTPEPSGGLNKFDRKSGTFTQYLHDPKNQKSLIDNAIRAICEDSQGNFWVGSRKNGLHLMNRTAGTFERIYYDPRYPEKLAAPQPLTTSSHITFIKEDPVGNLWIGTVENGVNRYDVVSKKITQYGLNGESSGSFTDNSGWWMLTSPDGALWMSTQESNLWEIDIFNTTVTYNERIQGAYSQALLYEAPGKLWIGSSGGLVKEDLVNHSLQYFKNNPQVKNSLPGNEIMDIENDGHGSIWVGTNNGLGHYDPATGTFLNYRNIPEDTTSISSNYVFEMLADGDSVLWVTTLNGLEQLNVKSGNFQTYLSGHFEVIFKGDKDILWLGSNTINGITRYNTVTRQARNYLPGLSIFAYHIDKDGTIWLPTLNGLYLYNKSADAFFPAEEVNPNLRINASIFAIVADAHDNLWMSSSIGIIMLNDKRSLFTVYGKENGISYDAIGYSGTAIDNAGRLYFVGFAGYYVIDPDQLNRKVSASALHFTRLWLEGRVVNPGSDGVLQRGIDYTKEIQLSFDQNTFDIGFTTIEFLNSPHDRITYMLENYDANWRLSNSENKASYFKVPPGDYTFRIKLDQNENNKETERSLRILITPPWWKTGWAYGFYFAAFIFSAYLIDQTQRKRIRERERSHAREKELEQAKEIEKAYTELKATQAQLIQSEKMASLGELTAGIAHEIQNPLNFVNNFSEVNSELIDELGQAVDKGNLNEVKSIAKDIKENEQKINHHGKRADAIVKGMLQHSRSSSGQNELTDINVLADEYLRLAYHGLRAKDKSFNATLNTDYDQTIENINIIPQDIGRMILNLINNAFYSVNERQKLLAASQEPLANYEPTVSISTKKEGNKVLISVKDNGNGIPQKILDKIFQPFFTTKPTGQGTGLGLSLSYDIVKAHGGEIKINTKVGEGSEFVVTLPVV